MSGRAESALGRAGRKLWEISVFGRLVGVALFAYAVAHLAGWVEPADQETAGVFGLIVGGAIFGGGVLTATHAATVGRAGETSRDEGHVRTG